MAKTKRQIQEDLKVIDVVVELLDARVPASSRNPDFESLLNQKPRIFLLNKADLAETAKTNQWIERFKQEDIPAAEVNAMSGAGIKKVVKFIEEAAKEKMEQLQRRGRRPRAIRVMIVGIPNVGKSSLINKMVGRSSTKTGDKPGVTRGKQWVRIGKQLELLDTPGVLWPKFKNEQQGFHLALTGAISDDLFDWEDVAIYFLDYLKQNNFSRVIERYGFENPASDSGEMLAQLGEKRGCMEKGGAVNLQKAAYLLIQEYRSGKLGHFTLELPE